MKKWDTSSKVFLAIAIAFVLLTATVWLTGYGSPTAKNPEPTTYPQLQCTIGKAVSLSTADSMSSIVFYNRLLPVGAAEINIGPTTLSSEEKSEIIIGFYEDLGIQIGDESPKEGWHYAAFPDHWVIRHEPSKGINGEVVRGDDVIVYDDGSGNAAMYVIVSNEPISSSPSSGFLLFHGEKQNEFEARFQFFLKDPPPRTVPPKGVLDS